MELNEKSLELVVSEKSLGTLTTNANQIKELVLSILPNYSVENYNESNIDQAKKDKALLNNSAKLLNAKRIELEKDFLKPFDEFKGIISETVKLIGDATSKIDSVVKESESKAKESKQKEIQEYWDSKEFGLVLLSKVWDDKWLNKTSKLKDIKAEIDSKITKINDDLHTLDLINENVDLLKSLYLDTLNINSTIQYSNTLKENQKKITASTPVQTETVAETIDEFEFDEDPLWDAEKFEPETSNLDSSDSTKMDSSESETLERIMKVTGTKDQLIALGDWMFENGIHFEKLENATA